MDKLTEEKKLIAQWMGWTVYNKSTSVNNYKRFYIKYIGWLKDFKPHEDANAWPEIWENMDEKQKFNYTLELKRIFKDVWFSVHTAPPEVCTKALLTTLRER